MTAPATAIDLGLAAERRAVMTAALASMPETFRDGDDGARVGLVDGAAGWCARAAAATSRVDGIVVVDPDPAPPREIAQLRDAPVPIVIASAWDSVRAIDRVAPHFRRMAGDGVLVEARAAISDSRHEAHLLALLATADRLLGERFVGGARLRTPEAFAIRARSASGVLLSATVATAPAGTETASFRIIAGAHAAELQLFTGASARPASASATDAEERTEYAPTFETPYTAALVRVRAAVSDGAAVDDAVRRLAAAELLAAAGAHDTHAPDLQEEHTDEH